LNGYTFCVDYPTVEEANTQVEMCLEHVTHQQVMNIQSDVKHAIQHLMRRLILLTQTLEPLPNERYLSMRLYYHDHTPMDYEPPCFMATPLGDIHFWCTPETTELGQVKTRYHAMHLRIHSIADRLKQNNGQWTVTSTPVQATQQSMILGTSTHPTMLWMTPSSQSNTGSMSIHEGNLTGLPSQVSSGKYGGWMYVDDLFF
jgi:hypothetical protein